MLIQTIIFYTTAILLICACLLTVISKKVMHSVLYALISFILCGFLFFALNAPFLGAIQISVYGIALSILFVIAINLTNCTKEDEIKVSPRLFLVISGVFMLCSAILTMMKESRLEYLHSSYLLTAFDNSKQLSSELLFHNLVAFELLGLYLLTALIGISVLLVFKGGR